MLRIYRNYSEKGMGFLFICLHFWILCINPFHKLREKAEVKSLICRVVIGLVAVILHHYWITYWILFTLHQALTQYYHHKQISLRSMDFFFWLWQDIAWILNSRVQFCVKHCVVIQEFIIIWNHNFSNPK